MARPQLSPAQREQGRRLAKALRDTRLELERDQAELARRSGVSVDAIRALEGGRTSTPSFMTVALLARDLRLGLDGLAEKVLGEE